MSFDGVMTALVTPFKKSTDALTSPVDFESLERLVSFQLESGIQGFVVSGTTGESPTLKLEEKREIFHHVQKRVNGRVPILVGTGTNSTRTTIELTQEAERWGADGALVVAPYYNKPPQRGMIAHFEAVAKSTKLPIVLYNVPGRTASEIGVEAMEELARVSNIVGIKEASGKMEIVDQMNQKLPNSFALLSGDDGTCVDFNLRGGAGVISVLSHIIPKELVAMVRQARDGNKPDFSKYARLNDLLFTEANPIPVKAALHLMKIIDCDDLRLPLVAVSQPLREKIERELRHLEIIS